MVILGKVNNGWYSLVMVHRYMHATEELMRTRIHKFTAFSSY